MITRLFTRDISLVFVASFFYMSCSFIATPLIASYSESLGAGAVFMGVIGATFNTVALLSRPFVGNLADRLSRAHLSTIGAALMLVGSAGVGHCALRAHWLSVGFPHRHGAGAGRAHCDPFCRR